ncbi:MAG: glucose-6-phosphate dehydrogenase, partial [Gemmataceae bacterium]|nr:glucose-6-phosphate dehydrogenase [Gemmataceae bacterium]
LDALVGDASLFMRADEIEQSWEIMEPFIQASEDPNFQSLSEYPVGSDGPSCAAALLARDGRKWQPIPA